MRIRGVDFVAVSVPQGRMAEARAFYEGVLGLTQEGIANESWVEYRVGNVTIGLDDWPFLTPPWDRQPAGEVRIALAVDDVGAALEELRGKGVRPAFGPSEADPCFIGAIRDPFGNIIILHRRRDGTVG